MPAQNAQHNHALCRSFFFCLASQESLRGASAVMVVTNSKREDGRPEREKVEKFGLRKKERTGDWGGRCGLRGGEDKTAGVCICASVGSEMLGRSNGFVEGVLCNFERVRLEVGAIAVGCDVDSGRKVVGRGDVTSAEEARERCDCEV
ncbi:hypothetical protein EJ02DRAFT_469683 [Clathrospora elynae]|uniref:Uncharacterized protein n=1 Tax=Clathrospora elynae TaxID=706981 RepID=A0A6A5SG38_9PLEO|nr:hypothetical protein EJ02DRAFT_469683 [Clathrospora elynae]